MIDRFMELKRVMRKKHITQQDLKTVLGLKSLSSVSHRFTGNIQWGMDEAYAVLELLDLPASEIYTYFPPDKKG